MKGQLLPHANSSVIQQHYIIESFKSLSRKIFRFVVQTDTSDCALGLEPFSSGQLALSQ